MLAKLSKNKYKKIIKITVILVIISQDVVLIFPELKQGVANSMN